MSAVKCDLVILGRPYAFSVPEEEAERLKAAADLINRRGEAIRANNRQLSAERLAITAALQVVFDALNGKLGEDEVAVSRVESLYQKCLNVLQSPS